VHFEIILNSINVVTNTPNFVPVALRITELKIIFTVPDINTNFYSKTTLEHY